MNDMKSHLPLRIWFMASITPAIGAVIVRLVWELTTATAVGTWVIVILLILVTLSIYTLLIYFTIKPGIKRLTSRPTRLWITAIATAAIISAIIHFIRFVPSPEAASPLSVIIATLLLMASVSAYLLVLWVIWSIGKARES